jgi:putative flippase GtrA
LTNKPLRFVLVGIANTSIDIVIFLALVNFGSELLTANIISTSVALAFSFFANRFFTFKSQGKKRTQIFAFLIVTLFGLWVIQPIIILLSMSILEQLFSSSLLLLIAKLIAVVFSMTWNYLLYDLLVFRKR